MSGVDYRQVRQRVSMAHVLELLAYEPTRRSGDQLRGPCPIHGSTSTRSRSLSVDLAEQRFQCFACQAKGNQLDLWAQTRDLALYEAAIDLCERAGCPVPWVDRW